MSMSTARQVLRRLWATVHVASCADGSIKITPKYRRQWRNPGVLTRMYSARMVSECLNIALPVPAKRSGKKGKRGISPREER